MPTYRCIAKNSHDKQCKKKIKSNIQLSRDKRLCNSHKEEKEEEKLDLPDIDDFIEKEKIFINLYENSTLLFELIEKLKKINTDYTKNIELQNYTIKLNKYLSPFIDYINFYKHLFFCYIVY